MKLVSYSEKNLNLGDVLQTITLKDFLKNRYNIDISGYCDRKKMNDDMIINGWHRNNEEMLPKKAFYIGLHSIPEMIINIDKNRVIGCRDFFTLNSVKKMGNYKTILSYCSSITLPVYLGERNGVQNYYHIDNNIGDDMTFEKRIQMTYDLIDELKTKELVYTDRLHIGLCCIALGTPVVIYRRKFQQERYSIFYKVPNFPGFGNVITLESGIKEFMERQFITAFEIIYEEVLNQKNND